MLEKNYSKTSLNNSLTEKNVIKKLLLISLLKFIVKLPDNIRISMECCLSSNFYN